MSRKKSRQKKQAKLNQEILGQTQNAPDIDADDAQCIDLSGEMLEISDNAKEDVLELSLSAKEENFSDDVIALDENDVICIDDENDLPPAPVPRQPDHREIPQNPPQDNNDEDVIALDENDVIALDENDVVALDENDVVALDENDVIALDENDVVALDDDIPPAPCGELPPLPIDNDMPPVPQVVPETPSEDAQVISMDFIALDEEQASGLIPVTLDICEEPSQIDLAKAQTLSQNDSSVSSVVAFAVQENTASISQDAVQTFEINQETPDTNQQLFLNSDINIIPDIPEAAEQENNNPDLALADTGIQSILPDPDQKTQVSYTETLDFDVDLNADENSEIIDIDLTDIASVSASDDTVVAPSARPIQQDSSEGLKPVPSRALSQLRFDKLAVSPELHVRKKQDSPALLNAAKNTDSQYAETSSASHNAQPKDAALQVDASLPNCNVARKDKVDNTDKSSAKDKDQNVTAADDLRAPSQIIETQHSFGALEIGIIFLLVFIILLILDSLYLNYFLDISKPYQPPAPEFHEIHPER